MLQLLVVAITVLANFAIAVAVYKRNPHSYSHLLLAALSIVTALWTVFNYLALLPGPESQRLFWVRVVMLVTTPYGSIIYLLAEVFPDSEIKLSKAKLSALLIFNIVTAFFALTPYMFAELHNTHNGSFSLTPAPAISLFAMALLGFMTAGFYKLVKKWRKSTGLLRRQLSLFLWGLITSVTLLSITNFVAVVVFGTIQLTAFGPPSTLILFVFMIYAIVKHRFLDITYLVARTVSYTFLLIAILLLYAVAIFALGSVLPANINRNILSALFAVVIAFSFTQLRSYIERVSDRFFFHGRYSTELLLEKLTRTMASEINVTKLTDKLLTTLKKDMRLTKAAFLIRDKNKRLSVANSGFKTERELHDGSLDALFSGQNQEFVIFEEISEGEKKKMLRDLDIVGVFLLRVKMKKVGYLVLGPKASGDIFTSQDIDLLQIFAPQAAIALQNAQSYKEIQQFNRTLEKKVDERTKELKETQKRELKKAKELLKLKDEFVFIATHDLGTPVTAISGYSKLLTDTKEKFSKDTKENIQAITEASDRLNQLTNDLLQVARSDAGTIKVEAEKVDFVEFFKEALAQVKIRAEERKISLTSNLHAAKIVVQADPEKLAEVLENLLSNAVKYNKDKGSVTVSTKKTDSFIEVSISDTGLGIPKEKQSQIFQKFFRAQQNGAESIPGTGLGLFVVKMMVEKMGGEISFKSKENEGTTFIFTLPAA